ncbi:MAG: SDR family oxidoreductase [Dehalococcoidia bacterium]|nr:SDR family oxidoreductase [Dehalococcoidia bacterium]
MGELDGKVAIVTGAGRLRGIGRAAAVALARQGADVAITGTGRDPKTFPEDEKQAGWRDVESTAEQVRAQGRRALPLTGDVANARDVQRMVEATLKQFGRIDILVNNAAAARGADRAPVTQLDESLFRRVLEVKVVGTFLFSKAVVPTLVKQGAGGRIINVSSIAGKRGGANGSAYSASNFGVQGFTQSLAMEVARHGITVNAVCPGVTDTSRMDSLGRGDTWEQLLERVPLHRAASDDEVGALIAWLCTPTASYITGQSLNFDGGMVMW